MVVNTPPPTETPPESQPVSNPTPSPVVSTNPVVTVPVEKLKNLKKNVFGVQFFIALLEGEIALKKIQYSTVKIGLQNHLESFKLLKFH